MVPILLLSAGLTLSRIDWSVAKIRVLVGLVVVTLGVASLLHPISSLFSPADALVRAESGMGGGYIGYTVFAGLAQFASPIGAWFLLMLLLVAGVLVLFNTSLDVLYEKSSTATVKSAGAIKKA